MIFLSSQARTRFSERSRVRLLYLTPYPRTPLTASAGSSCTAACEHAGMRCSARHFAVLNSCKALGTAFGSALPCALDFYGPDLPAALPSAGILMTNR